MTIKPITGIYFTFLLTGLVLSNESLHWMPSDVQWALIGYIGIFGAITWFFSKSMTQAKSGKVWINQFLASIAIKMFTTLSYLTIFLYLNKDWETAQKLQLAIGAFVVYILYTILLAANKPSAE
ncbi:MAG: hypothetical protein RLZZ205_1005 [Bacteroidota bacterium]|jgi:hypothetical protein